MSQTPTHFDLAVWLYFFGMLLAVSTEQNSIKNNSIINAEDTANNPQTGINSEIKRHQGAYKELGCRRLLPIAAEELFGLSNKCTFDINSLSGTLLMARGVCVQLFCLAQLLAPCGSSATD